MNDKPHPLFDRYCKDNAAGDWHRPFENYCAGYQAATAALKAKCAFPEVCPEHAQEHHDLQVAKAGCLRYNTPKKCAVHGCCPGTWPSESPDAVGERLTNLLREARLLCDWIAETPHSRGSVNGKASQLGYAIRNAIGE